MRIMIKAFVIGAGIFVTFYLISPLFGLMPETVSPVITEVTGETFDPITFVLMGIFLSVMGGMTAIGHIPWNQLAFFMAPIILIFCGRWVYPYPDTLWLLVPFVTTHLIFGLGLAKKIGLKTVKPL